MDMKLYEKLAERSAEDANKHYGYMLGSPVQVNSVCSDESEKILKICFCTGKDFVFDLKGRRTDYDRYADHVFDILLNLLTSTDTYYEEEWAVIAMQISDGVYYRKKRGLYDSDPLHDITCIVHTDNLAMYGDYHGRANVM